MIRKNKIPIVDAQIIMRVVPQNLQDIDVQLFEHEFNIVNKASYYYKFRHALFVEDTVVGLPWFNFYPEETHLNGSFSREQIKTYRSKLSIPTSFHAKLVWITQNWTWMYFHWITDALTRYIAIEPMLDGHLVAVPSHYKTFSYVEQSLRFLGIPFVWYDTSKTTYVKELILPSHTSIPGNYHLDFIHKLRDLFHSKLTKTTPFRKIYISRSKANSRKLMNELDLISMLLDFGFEVHCMEDYSFEKQVQLMFETTHLLGVHGGGLTNILFLQSRAKVMEIRMQGDAHNNCYFSLASALDNPYFYVQVKVMDATELNLQVDVELIKQNFKDFFYE